MRNVYKLELLILRAIFKISLKKYNKRTNVSMRSKYSKLYVRKKN